MKLRKIFTFSGKNQIWRMLISSSDKLVVETRNTEKKEVFFSCIDLVKGKKIFRDLQLEERFWIGIETIYNDTIFFHKFAKPNMPEHKNIIAYDIKQEKIIWQNEELSFLSLFDGKIYAFKKKFEGRELFALDYFSGSLIDELGSDPIKISHILKSAQLNEDFSDYRYPELYNSNDDNQISSLVENEIVGKDILDNIEILIYDGIVFFNYYLKNKNNLLDNVFSVYNIDKKKKVFSETINRNLNSFSPDSFFCYKNYLLLLKNKTEIVTYKIN